MDCKEGVVTKIERDHIIVRMIRSSACSGCHAKGVCHSGDAKEEDLHVSDFPDGLAEGDRVRILFPDTKGLKAVVYAFVLPLVLLILGVIVLTRYEMSEVSMVLSLLALMAVYYLILTMFRKRFIKTFELKVERI